MLRINNIKINKDLSNEELFNFFTNKFHIIQKDILSWNISKKSIDARNKNNIHYIYNIDFKVNNENKYSKFSKIKEYEEPTINIKRKSNLRPVIIGAGPAGLFAGITMVQNGLKPIIIEQGSKVENRQKEVQEFFTTGKLNSLSNVQFGEGGAGTFSDGKLTTNINNPLCFKVLKEFVKFGAPEQILYVSKPHIGTDNLINILKNIRNYIIKGGGEFLFNEKVTDFEIKNNKITAVFCNKKIETDCVVLAIGHSSRDTFETLYSRGVSMKAKNFSVGVRIEHLQSDINTAQYGTSINLKLPPAEYKLAYHSPNGRSCYTFCMCPGRKCYSFI